MASKRRSRAVEIRVNYSTRRAKSSRQAKKLEDTKLISGQLSRDKNVIREIEKPKSHTDNKPHEAKPKSPKKPLKQKKVHKCSICLKVFKGNDALQGKYKNFIFKHFYLLIQVSMTFESICEFTAMR